MPRRTVRIFFLFAFLTCTVFKSFSQDSTWPPKEWKDSVYSIRTRGGWASTRNLFGDLVIKNGDTFRGCYFRPWAFDGYVLPPGQIHPVKIEYNKLIYFSAKNQVEFRPIYKDRLWRLIAQKGNISIYDLSVNSNVNDFGTPMLLKKGEKITKMYGSLTWPELTNKNQLILNFINSRYHKSFKPQDFKTGMGMIYYILEEENKK